MAGQIALPNDGYLGQVIEANSIQIRINFNIEDGDCTFELIDGRYAVHIKGNLKPLTTAVCEFSEDLPQLLAKGGSVMAVCYGLYKLGYSAWNFSPGSLVFELVVGEAQLETIRRQLTKGRFADLLQDEVDVITQKYHLKKFKIVSAKEVPIKETDKQSGSVFKAENVNVDHGAVLASNVIIGEGAAAFNPQESHPPQPLPQNVTMKDVTVTHGAVGAWNVRIDTKK